MTLVADLQGRVALVTGAGRGLGLEIAKALARSSAHVLLNGRQHAPLESAAEAIAGDGGSVEVVPFDIADSAAVDAAFRHIGDRVDILVNNVGVRHRRPLRDFSRADIERLLASDLVAPFELSRRVAGAMQRRGWGRIVNITSIAGPIARAGDALYTTAKGGLEAMTRALAAELGPYGITVNAVAPGYFATEMNSEWMSGGGAEMMKHIPMRRFGNEGELDGALLLLAAPRGGSYITGVTYAVDGGHTLQIAGV